MFGVQLAIQWVDVDEMTNLSRVECNADRQEGERVKGL